MSDEEMKALAIFVVEAKRKQDEMLARMSPAEREAWINQWAQDVAEEEVAIGCALDEALK